MSNVVGAAQTLLQSAGGEQLNAPSGFAEDLGSLAANYDGGPPATHDVVHDYPWTLSNVKGRSDIPQIILNEHRCNESVLMRQMAFYAKGAGASTANNVWQTIQNVLPGQGQQTSAKGLLSVYEEIFPDSPTNNKYIFPYFNKILMELNTSQWEQIDDASNAIDQLAGGASDFLKKMGAKGVAKNIDVARAWGGAATAGYEAALKAQYPVVGVFDRPRVFTSHTERAITVEFPLLNTKNAFDWVKNRDLIYKLMTQNLYNKRDYITGSPPVYYRVLIPGQYFCFASCVTNFRVENLGNTRMEYGSFIVPDAYQVSITLQEMVMPSLNQFQAVTTGEANSRVSVGRTQ